MLAKVILENTDPLCYSVHQCDTVHHQNRRGEYIQEATSDL